jgi:hypothetical protein
LCKWLIFIGQFSFGIAYLGARTEENLKMVQSSLAGILSNVDFIANQQFIVAGMRYQLILLVVIIIISKSKPWARKRLEG